MIRTGPFVAVHVLRRPAGPAGEFGHVALEPVHHGAGPLVRLPGRVALPPRCVQLCPGRVEGSLGCVHPPVRGAEPGISLLQGVYRSKIRRGV
jgi:hypothetical protein